MTKNLLTLAVLVGAALCGLALIPSKGLAGSSAYTFRDGYWWRGDQAYNRHRSYLPYTYGGYRYYEWVYYPVPTVVKRSVTFKKNPTPVPAYTTEWRKQLLAIAANRDATEGKLRIMSLDHQAYLEAVNALGLGGNFRWSNYGTFGVFPRQGYSSSSKSAAYEPVLQGQANYAYSVTQARQMWGDFDTNQAFQSAVRLTERAQDLAGDGNRGIQDNLKLALAAHDRAAAILAEGAAKRDSLEAVARVLLAARPSPASKETTTTTVTGSAPVKMPKVEDEEKEDPRTKLAAFMTDVAVPQCAGCHGESKPEGGFKISTYATGGPAVKKKVWMRILTHSPAKPQMPLDRDGKSKPMSDALLRKWLSN